MLKKTPLFPFLIALYPILFLYAHNIDELFPYTLLIPSLTSIFICLFTYLSSVLMTRNKIKAALITSIFFICFYTFGAIQDFFILHILPSKILYILFLVISFLYLSWRFILYFSEKEKEEKSIKLGIYIYLLSGLFFLNIFASYFTGNGFKISSLLILLFTLVFLFGFADSIVRFLLNKLIKILPGFQYFLSIFFTIILLYIITYQIGFAGITHRRLIPIACSFLILILVFNYYYKNYNIKKYILISLTVIILALVFFLLYKYSVTLFYNLIPELIISLAAISIVLKIIFSKSSFERLNPVLNISTLLLIAFPIFSIIKFEISYWQNRQNISHPEIIISENTEQALYPIYYIVLDEYASTQTIKELFAYDNTPFVGNLKERGFYVNDWQSTSEITQEVMAGILNLGNYPLNLSGRDNFRGIQNNFVVKYLKALNYKIIQYDVIRYENNFTFKDTDSLINLPLIGIRSRLSDYNEKILYSSLVRRYIPQENNFYRTVINNIFNSLPEIHKNFINEPIFIYAHFSSPHAPFVFDSIGNEIGYQTDGYQYYLGQYVYLNKKTEEMVDKLLAIHDGKCVIIIQSDHGPREEETGILTSIKQKRQIFSALYFPDKNYDIITDSVSLNLNTFAFVFNEIFDTQFELKTIQRSSD